MRIVALLLGVLCVTSVKSQEKIYDVIILGAGYSGIGAALHFHNNNFRNFLVLEAKDYIGGRVRSANFSGVTVGLGAGWIHDAGTHNSVFQLAKKHSIQWLQKDDYTRTRYRRADTGKLIEKWQWRNAERDFRTKMREVVNITTNRIQQGRGDIDVKTGMRMAGWRTERDMIKAGMEYFMFDFENGVEPDVLSAGSFGHTGSGIDYVVTDPRGYEYPLLEEAKVVNGYIKLNTDVVRVHWYNNLYRVWSSRGIYYEAKHILVTFSSGVLLSKRVHFYPPIPPWKMEALNMVPMCHYCKLFLKFDTIFWDTDIGFIVLLTKFRGQYQLWQNFELKTLFPGSKMLMATLTGDICKEKHYSSDDEVIKEMMEAIKKVYPNASPPSGFTRNKWSLDPHFMGAYSYQVPGISTDDYEALDHPVERKMWFTGEYTGKWKYGYTHKAFDLGGEAAARIIKCFKGFCPDLLPQRTGTPCTVK